MFSNRLDTIELSVTLRWGDRPQIFVNSIFRNSLRTLAFDGHIFCREGVHPNFWLKEWVIRIFKTETKVEKRWGSSILGI